jgi:glycosyltransferase involved in cell wall biosynthesis
MMLESDGPGGAEMMMFRLSEELRARGHTVVPVGPVKGIGWLGDLFRDAGVSPEAFHLKRPVDPGCVRGLMQLFREHRIDAVHSHEFTMAVYGAAASRLLNLPHLITMHGGFKACKVLRRRVALRWAMRNSNHTVMVSQATRQQFASELGVDPGNFAVVPNGVPAREGNASKARSEFRVGRDECVLLAVGTLERHKGHDVLIRALAGLTRDGVGVPWRLIIAGGRGGDQHEPLKKLVGIEGLEGRVHIVTNRNDIPDLLALSDVFVMPSLWEGLPMALLEAMLAGKAVVASATAGIPEAVVNERDGILTAPGSVTQLGAALRDLLENPAKRLVLGTAAAVRARKEFTVGVMAARYEALYREPAVATRRIAGDRMFDPLLSLVVGDATRAPAYSPMPLSKQHF